VADIVLTVVWYQVSLVDKRDLVAYLTGETSTNPAIDSSFDALVTPTAVPVQKHTIPATDDRSAKKCAFAVRDDLMLP
jgi:hypothetical protein